MQKIFSVLIVLAIITCALLQTILGTLGTVLINADVGGSDPANSTNVSPVEQFFSKYVLGSHGFVAALMEDTFWLVLSWLSGTMAQWYSDAVVTTRFNKDYSYEFWSHGAIEPSVGVEIPEFTYLLRTVKYLQVHTLAKKNFLGASWV